MIFQIFADPFYPFADISTCPKQVLPIQMTGVWNKLQISM